MRRIILSVLALAMLASCQKEQKPFNVKDTSIRFSIGITTKATDNAYENGDKVGIYMSYGALQGKGNYRDNNAYTLSGSSWETDSEIYWKDGETPADFYCYHPYAAVADATAFPFAVKADQSLLENYKASDLLWGKKTGIQPSAETIALSSSHILSNIYIVLKPGEGYEAAEFAAAKKSVILSNVKNNATVNLSNGGVQATGDAGTIQPYYTGEKFRAMVIPQAVGTDNNFLIVTVDGATYYLASGFTFVSGMSHQLNVTVNKSTSGLSISVEDWKTDENEHNVDVH